MNQQRRKELQRASDLIDQAKSMLELIMESEQEAFDNMPESFQFGEKGDKAQNAIDNIESSIDGLRDAIDYIGEAIE